MLSDRDEFFVSRLAREELSLALTELLHEVGRGTHPVPDRARSQAFGRRAGERGLEAPTIISMPPIETRKGTDVRLRPVPARPDDMMDVIVNAIGEDRLARAQERQRFAPQFTLFGGKATFLAKLSDRRITHLLAQNALQVSPRERAVAVQDVEQRRIGDRARIAPVQET